MKSVELIHGSVKYIKSRIVVTKDSQPYNPTVSVVKWAFVAPGDDVADATWTTGSWESTGDRYWARCLLGADVVLAVGTYSVFWHVFDNPELPMEYAGQLVVS